MAALADRMKATRKRRRARGMRELRLALPDARSQEVRRRVAAAVAVLRAQSEREAIDWIEGVSEFDRR